MHRQRARKLGPEEILRQLQDISKDESDTSDDDIFDPNGNEDEDYEPPRPASNSSSDCDAEDTCRLEEDLVDNVQQKFIPAMNVGQTVCCTRRRDTARENRGRERRRGTRALGTTRPNTIYNPECLRVQIPFGLVIIH